MAQDVHVYLQVALPRFRCTFVILLHDGVWQHMVLCEFCVRMTPVSRCVERTNSTLHSSILSRPGSARSLIERQPKGGDI